MNNNIPMNKPKSNTGLVIGLSLVVLLIIAVIGFFMYKQFNPAHTSGDSCTPSGKEKVKNAESDTYEYDSDGDCKPTGCVDKYSFDSSALTCTKTKTSGKCTPSDDDKVANAESDSYQYDSDGDCEPTECVTGYTPSTSGPFACTTTPKGGTTCTPTKPETIAGADSDSYQYDSDGDCEPTGCAKGYVFNRPTGGPVSCTQSDIKFKLYNTRGACLVWTVFDENGAVYKKQHWGSMCDGAKKTIDIPPTGSLSIKNELHHTTNWTIDEIIAILPPGCNKINSYGKGYHAYIKGKC